MDSLYVVVLATIALAVACISFSTWTTVGDLKDIVRSSESQRPHSDASGDEHHDWHELASRAIGHIEHLPYDQHQAEPVVLHRGDTGAALVAACNMHPG